MSHYIINQNLKIHQQPFFLNYMAIKKEKREAKIKKDEKKKKKKIKEIPEQNHD